MSDEWVVGPLWVRPVAVGRWELGIEDGPADQRSATVGFIVRVSNAFEVTTVATLLTEPSFGSLLAAIDFITNTLPARGNASGAFWTPSDDRDSSSQSVTSQ
ncbi:hypothetical protein E3T55_00525 [Cryobacterium frigoriphilum]|uniref:Uncharacterized protein n=1 Tax=Cryobacterium frigoriphilum TaxID=1259150 RepID=A0A4R9ABS4_9MICO|nr:hypothetical protein [Cryobacterium frigoriphilum]TFD55843.1 hypothetical protein E3T55_00525 [Cryobacterium frigoriphilum]